MLTSANGDISKDHAAGSKPNIIAHSDAAAEFCTLDIKFRHENDKLVLVNPDSLKMIMD